MDDKDQELIRDLHRLNSYLHAMSFLAKEPPPNGPTLLNRAVDRIEQLIRQQDETRRTAGG